MIKRRDIPQFRPFGLHAVGLDLFVRLLNFCNPPHLSVALICELPAPAFSADTYVWRFLSDFSVDMNRSDREFRCRMMRAVMESTRTFTATT